jgi:hypothetical protein
MSRYEVRAQRNGRFWSLRVPAVRRSTQARHLREIETMARDLVHIMTGEPEDSIELAIEYVVPRDARKHLHLAEKWRLSADNAHARASSESQLAARSLHEAGISYRDIGLLLGVSHQTAHKLVANEQLPTPAAPPRA